MPELGRSSPADDDILTRSEAEELVRLLAALIRSDPSGSEVEKFIRVAGRQPANRMALVDRARSVVAERRRRTRFLAPTIFGEPGWDILLALYTAEVSGPRQSVGSVSNLIEKPLTTAIRWINYLEKERLIVREPHPLDSRMLLLELTDKSRQVLDDYFATLPHEITSI